MGHSSRGAAACQRALTGGPGDQEKFFFAPLNETQHVYSKPFRITQPIVVTRDSELLTITGTVRYQACDDVLCYVPLTVAVKWTVPVAGQSPVKER